MGAEAVLALHPAHELLGPLSTTNPCATLCIHRAGGMFHSLKHFHDGRHGPVRICIWRSLHSGMRGGARKHSA